MEQKSYRNIITFAVHIILAVALAWFLSYGFGLSTVQGGQSMEPTINVDDTIIIDRISYHFNSPERYDVIAFPSIDDEEKIDIKRVIGLPGETVQIYDGRIYIDGESLKDRETYNKVTLAGLAAEPILLGNNEYFVLGDNRYASEDSRFDKLGNVKQNAIIGKVWFRTKPFSRLGRVR